jgi:hypothetical protein
LKSLHSTSRPLLAFVHIEKAAGTTLIYVLRRNYALRYLDVRPLRSASGGVLTASDLRSYLRINPFLRAFGGHAVKPYSDLEAVAPNVRYVTILRDPVHRYLSQYGYWRRALKKDWSFERFLDHEAAHNFQTKKLVGSDDVAAAKRMLATRFFVVGVAEEFDRFLADLVNKLRPDRFDPGYVRRNASTESEAGVSALFERHRDRIVSNNARDIELYRYAVDEILPDRRANDASGGHAAPHHAAGGGHDLRLVVDSICRKVYYEPVTGLMRKLGGLPMQGSY